MAAGGTDVVGVAGRVKDPNIKDCDNDLVKQFYNNVQEAFSGVGGNLKAMNLPYLEGKTKKIATNNIEVLRRVFSRDPTLSGQWDCFDVCDDDPYFPDKSERWIDVEFNEDKALYDWSDLAYIWCPLATNIITINCDNRDLGRERDAITYSFNKPFEILFKAVSKQFEEP
tara:strand:- start:218 stop:727 length:510 start_codon:yes stop_codon:yes gene_type:complete